MSINIKLYQVVNEGEMSKPTWFGIVKTKVFSLHEDKTNFKIICRIPFYKVFKSYYTTDSIIEKQGFLRNVAVFRLRITYDNRKYWSFDIITEPFDNIWE